MLTHEVVIRNKSGLHARPAALFCRLAAKWSSSIQLENLSRSVGPVDGKSMLRVLTLGVESGHRLRLTVAGTDEDEALAALMSSIEEGLGEALAAAEEIAPAP